VGCVEVFVNDGVIDSTSAFDVPGVLGLDAESYDTYPGTDDELEAPEELEGTLD
jgi:hypothetical protein